MLVNAKFPGGNVGSLLSFLSHGGKENISLG